MSLLALVVTSCTKSDTATIRYEVSVRLKVGERVVSGTSVQEVTYTDTPNSLSRFEMAVSHKGEGVVLDAGKGDKSIFLLLAQRSKSAVFPRIVMQCFGIIPGRVDFYITELKAIPIGKTCEFKDTHKQISLMPLIVTFQDMEEPKSIVGLGDPAFKSAIGATVHLIDIKLKRVDPDTSLTQAMDAALPWLEGIRTGKTWRVLDPPQKGTRVSMADATLAQIVSDTFFKDE